MAEFCKQWAEINDPEGGWDFDVEEIVNQLEPNHYVPIICEGFGFIAVGKDADNNIMLAMPTGKFETDEDGQTFDQITWQTYEDIIK